MTVITVKTKTLLLSLSVLLIASAAQAAIIVSINMARNGGTYISSNGTNTVGAAVDAGSPAAYWNNVDLQFVNNPTGGPDEPSSGWYVDNSGSAVSTSFNFTLDNTAGVRAANDGDVDGQLQRSFTRSQTTLVNGANDLTLTDTAAVFGASGLFDLYVYTGLRSSDPATLEVQVNVTSTVYSLTGTSADQNGSFVQGTDYLVIPNIAATSGTIGFDVAVTSGNASTMGVAGIQLVQVPEPSTYAMLAGALALGLVMLRRRS